MASNVGRGPGWVASEQDAELAAIFAQTEAGLAQVDLTGRFTLVNDRFCEMVGRSRGALQAMKMQDITHPDDLDNNLTLFEAAVRNGTPYRIEKRFLRPDGSAIWVDNSVGVIRKSDGTAFGVLAVSIDITRRREAEVALRASELRLRLAMDAGRMAVWEYDARASRVLHSSDLNRLLGFIETRDVSYEEFRARIDPQDMERLSAVAVASLRARDPHFQAEVRYRLSRGEVRWLLICGEFLRRPGGELDRIIGVALDITDRKRDEEHQQLLVHELTHRVKNTLAVVQALAHRSFAGSRDTARVEAFEGRLIALAGAHSLLTSENWEAASLRDVIISAAVPCDPDGARLILEGPDIRVPPKTAVSLALAVHELCTNAMKYGALSNESGHIDVRWTIDDDWLRIRWAEIGGPSVAVPLERGFGSLMLEGALARELGGTVILDFEPTGLCCTIDAPTSAGVFIVS